MGEPGGPGSGFFVCVFTATAGNSQGEGGASGYSRGRVRRGKDPSWKSVHMVSTRRINANAKVTGEYLEKKESDGRGGRLSKPLEKNESS